MKTILLSITCILFTSFFLAQIPSYIPTNGLVGYWPFNGNANDLSGNNNNGTISGTTALTSNRFNEVNNAFVWDGTNSPITIQNASNQNFQTGVTFSVWIYQTNMYCNSCSETNYVTKGRNIDQGGISLGLDHQTQKFVFRVTGNPVSTSPPYSYFYSSSNIIYSTWTHLAGTYDGSTLKIFINGNLDISYNYISSLQINQDNILFGRQKGTNVYADNFNMVGKLDDIGIWNRALTQQEISTLYASSSTNLPVELVSFEGICDASNVSILWQTASEHNSKSFELEKSRNGEDWFLIDQQAAAENSTILTTYAFKEASENIVQIIYYRLRQIDINGESKLYGPIAIKCDNQFTTDFNILANPTNCSVPIQFNNLIPLSDNLIEINSLNGSTLIKKQFNTNSAALFLELDVSSLVKGTYFVTLNKNASTTQRLLLE